MLRFSLAVFTLKKYNLTVRNLYVKDNLKTFFFKLKFKSEVKFCLPFYSFVVADYVNTTRAFHITGTIILLVAAFSLAYLLTRPDDSVKRISVVYILGGKWDNDLM